MSQRYVEKRGANHGLHVVLSILTCGLWAITGWPIATAMGRKTVTTGPPPGYPPTGMPPQQPYGYPPQQQPYQAPPYYGPQQGQQPPPGPYNPPPGQYGPPPQ